MKCRDLSIDIIDIAFHDQNISKTHPNSFRHISTMIPLSPVFKSRSKTPTASHTYSLIRTALSCVSSCFFHLPPAKIQTMIWRNQAVIGCGGHRPRAVFQSWFMNFASPVCHKQLAEEWFQCERTLGLVNDRHSNRKP